jgi:retron-type reverse transcriptase
MTLFAQLASWDNLLLAFHNASRGKRKNGNVAAFEHRLEDNLWQLHAELQQQKYHPSGYHSFFIRDPKRRLISAAPFRDRVVHHALCQLIQPPFERSFITHSFANRVGKGTHRARQQCQAYCRLYPYVLQCDIRQFFPSIDHTILENCLTKKVKDEKIMRLIQLILQSGKDVLREQYSMVYFPGDDLFAISRPRGLPIGNLTSQLWANVYLNPFDHFVKRQLRCKAYLRYVDDFLLFADSKKQLWYWKQQLEQFLQKLRLTIHPGSHPRPVAEGIPFLGFQIFPHRIRLKPRNGYNYRRKLKKMLFQYQNGEISFDQITASVQGWVNHSRYGNTMGLRKAILSGEQIPPAPPEAEATG